MTDEIVNKVALSGLVSLDLETLWPTEPLLEYDLAQHLWQGLILREMDYRAALKQVNWGQYAGCHVAICCSADAIVPTWAYMLLALQLAPIATSVHYCSLAALEEKVLMQSIEAIDLSPFFGAKVVVKGCGDHPVPEAAYVAITTKLAPVVQSLMFGEPCSTVPLYKKPKQ